MAYDPQKNRRRPTPPEAGPAPVDALISTDPTPPLPGPDDPAPAPTVTPPPADPPPDALVLNSGLVAAIGAVGAAFLARYLWRRRRHNSGGE